MRFLYCTDKALTRIIIIYSYIRKKKQIIIVFLLLQHNKRVTAQNKSDVSGVMNYASII